MKYSPGCMVLDSPRPTGRSAPVNCSPDWIVDGNQLRTVGKSSFDLYVVNHLGHAVHNVFAFQDRSSERHDLRNRFTVAGGFEYFSRDDGDRLRVIELQSARLPFACDFSGNEDEQFLLFARCQVHDLDSLRSASCQLAWRTNSLR